MRQRLLVAGSNSGCQLGLGHDRDAPELEQAICVEAGSDSHSAFPPPNWTVKQVSSGSNHTLALLEPINKSDLGHKQLWATGTGAQGQLGAALAASPEPVKTFELFDWQRALALDGFCRPEFDADAYELKDVVCGWNISYIVLQPRSLSESLDDVLFSLGLARDNAFGELGVLPSEDAKATRCAHRIPLYHLLETTDLAAIRITALAAGLRHAIAEIQCETAGKYSLSLIVGWGSARHGQVGSVPPQIRNPALPPKKPGFLHPIVFEPQCMVKAYHGNSRLPAVLRAGQAHSVVLTHSSDGGQSLHSFGSNRQGQLTLCHRFSEGILSAGDIFQIACNWNSTQFYVKNQYANSYSIRGSGSNARGQLGSGPARIPHDLSDNVKLDHIGSFAASGDKAMKVQKLVSGSEHSLLLVGSVPNPAQSLEQVWGYGWNEHGNLAQGVHDESDRTVPVPILPGSRSGSADLSTTVPSDPLPSLQPVDVWAGCGTTFILTNVS